MCVTNTDRDYQTFIWDTNHLVNRTSQIAVCNSLILIRPHCFKYVSDIVVNHIL